MDEFEHTLGDIRLGSFTCCCVQVTMSWTITEQQRSAARLGWGVMGGQSSWTECEIRVVSSVKKSSKDTAIE